MNPCCSRAMAGNTPAVDNFGSKRFEGSATGVSGCELRTAKHVGGPANGAQITKHGGNRASG